MNKTIIIGLCIGLIALAGCNKEELKLLYTQNVSFGNICVSNTSTAPTERFCNESGMRLSKYSEGLLHNGWGCVDDNGEIHKFVTKPYRDINKWVIGNKTYDMEWTC